MPASGARKELPSWALPVVIVLGVLVLIFLGWKALTGTNSVPGTPKEVHPGMYNFRQEVLKGNVGRHR
jgi:threonine/homoserine/homoserine lactone efflux protein